MKVKIVEIKHIVPSVCPKYILKYRRFWFWCTVVQDQVISDGEFFTSYRMPIKFESENAAENYALANFKKVKFV